MSSQLTDTRDKLADMISPLLECQESTPHLNARADRAKALVFADPSSKR